MRRTHGAPSSSFPDGREDELILCLILSDCFAHQCLPLLPCEPLDIDVPELLLLIRAVNGKYCRA